MNNPERQSTTTKPSRSFSADRDGQLAQAFSASQHARCRVPDAGCNDWRGTLHHIPHPSPNQESRTVALSHPLFLHPRGQPSRTIRAEGGRPTRRSSDRHPERTRRTRRDTRTRTRRSQGQKNHHERIEGTVETGGDACGG